MCVGGGAGLGVLLDAETDKTVDSSVYGDVQMYITYGIQLAVTGQTSRVRRYILTVVYTHVGRVAYIIV